MVQASQDIVFQGRLLTADSPDVKLLLRLLAPIAMDRAKRYSEMMVVPL